MTPRRTKPRARAKRTEPDTRRAEILEASIQLARRVGYYRLTRAAVAQLVGMSDAAVGRYYCPMAHLRASVLREGIARRIPEILAQAVAEGDYRLDKAPADVQELVLAHFRPRG